MSEGRKCEDWPWAVRKGMWVHFPEVGEQLDTPPPKKTTPAELCQVEGREEHLGTENNVCKSEQWEGL